MALIEAGIGMGGETKPETNLSSTGLGDMEAAGYTDATWLSTVEDISNLYAHDFTKTRAARLAPDHKLSRTAAGISDAGGLVRGRHALGGVSRTTP